MGRNSTVSAHNCRLSVVSCTSWVGEMLESEVEEIVKSMQTKWRRFGVDLSMGRVHQGVSSVKLPGLMVYPTVSLGGVRRDIPGRVKRRQGRSHEDIGE